jgi:hypothetical protein
MPRSSRRRLRIACAGPQRGDTWPLISRKELADELKLGPPERNVLWALEAALEKTLVPPFQADCEAQLAAARKSVVERLGE